MLAYRNVPTECLLNKIIDEDFQAMLFPLIIIQTIFVLTKFGIINNFITPKYNLRHFITTTVAVLILICCFIFRFLYYYKSVEDFANTVISFLIYFDVVFYIIATIIIYVASACYSSSSVELIMKLQKCLNLIQIDKKPLLFKLKRENWISVVFMVCVYAAFCFVHSYAKVGFIAVLIHFVLVAPSLVLDIEIITVTRIVVIIRNVLVAWNDVMKQYQKQNNEEDKKCYFLENDMLDAFVNIIKAFRLCNKIYQISYTLFVFQTFIHLLANLELVLAFGTLGPNAEIFQALIVKLSIGFWNLKNVILIITLSIACENFYGAVKSAEDSCAQILSIDQATGMRRTCKNVVRVSRAALRKLSACGVFELDATLPLRLLAALLAYTVVLLQFAFL